MDLLLNESDSASTSESADTGETAVETENLFIEFEDYTPVKDVSVRIESGRSVAIMGQSGSGKSTFLKAAAGLIPATSGTVRIFGELLGPLSNRELLRLRRTCGFVFQDGALWQNMSLYRNLALPLEHHLPHSTRAERDSRIQRAIRRIDFRDDLSLRPAALSAGEGKLIAFVRAFLTEPRMLMLDEPTTFVDRAGVERILSILKELKRGGTTLVIVSHNASVVSQLADEIIVIDEGTVRIHGTPSEVGACDDPRVREVVQDVLGHAATFDGDILSLLDDD